MTLSDAVFTRSSCRDFSPAPLSPIQRRQLEAHQFLPRGKTGGAALFVIGAPHPAGRQSHGLGGEDQLLAVEAALFFQILISGGSLPWAPPPTRRARRRAVP